MCERRFERWDVEDGAQEGKEHIGASWVAMGVSVECVFCMRWGNSSVVERWIPDPAVGGSIPSSLIFCTTEQPNAPSRAHHSRHSTLYARRLEAHSLCQRYVLLLVLTHAHTHTYKHGHTYTLGACMFVVCLFVCLFVRCIRCTDECMHLCMCVLACMCAKCGGSKSGTSRFMRVILAQGPC